MATHSALEALVEDMTLRQLADRSGRSVAAIVEWALGSRRSSADANPGSKAAPPKRGSGSVDVRTQAGRVAYDAAVLEILTTAGQPTSAQHVRKAVGGSPSQARAALNRLIEAGTIGYRGRARATRYFIK